MKKYIAVIGIFTLAACSNHQNDVVGVNSDGDNYTNERLACKQSLNSKSPIIDNECPTTAKFEALEDKSKENLAERKLQETRNIGRVLDRSH